MAEVTLDRPGVAGRVRGFIGRTRTFIGEVREEMRKVTWPDRPQLINSTWVILIFVLVVSLIIFVMDWSVRGILDVVINVFGG